MRSDALLERMITLHPKIIDLTLDRMWRVLEALGNPQERLPPVIHVAGTNGKGSTIAMLRAGLEGRGDTAHVYTSPHLVRFHERIRLAGRLIEEDALSDLLDRCLRANGPDPITYFEITTAAALTAFAETPADWTLLEVGLGGRLDATNVIENPALCVITPIDLDHQQFLGDDIESIAAEKAGILKRDVPCIVARQQDAALDVIEARAARVGAPLMIHGQHWHAWEERGRLIFQDENGLLDLPLPALAGPHQVENAGTALAGLRRLELGETAFEAAMTNAEWPARMQRLRQGRWAEMAPEAEIWLDGGHNPHAGKALAATLEGLPARPTYFVCGMLKTKDAQGYFEALAPMSEGLIAVSIPGQEATLAAEETARMAAQAGHSAQSASSIERAMDAILALAPSARIVICGSLYFAGEVLRQNA
ncbi:MAG: folylpolyglutamate synthase/dihydrofolate synthase family protein [Pseudomonadota bacterium]